MPLHERSADVPLGDLVETAPDGVVVVDPAGRILLANRRFERLFGYARAELLGEKVEQLVPGGLRLRGSDDAEIALARRRDGTEFPAEVAVAAFDGEEGPLLSAIVRPARDRGGGEAGDEIKRLREIAEFRARFLNVAAHELKTPLTPIRLQLQILQKRLEGAPAETQRSLTILARSVERLQSLMNDVLDAARIQADKLVVRKEPVSVSDVAKEAVENYRAVARELGVALNADIQPDVRSLGDAGRLLQIVTNLLSNALKFTTAGGDVHLSVRKEDEWVAIRCVDTGRGMTPAQLARLFQPFSQVHPDLEATKRGTGLGLYITQAIVEQHGGTVSVTSPGEGHGTTATVLLPATTDRIPERRPDAKTIAMKDRLREMV